MALNERPCTPASGWDCASGRHRVEPGGAGQIENQVGHVREWLFTPTPRFADFAALNAWLATRCRELGARRHPTQDATISEIFALEQPMLQRSEEHTSELQSPSIISYAVCADADRDHLACPFGRNAVAIAVY